MHAVYKSASAAPRHHHILLVVTQSHHHHRIRLASEHATATRFTCQTHDNNNSNNNLSIAFNVIKIRTWFASGNGAQRIYSSKRKSDKSTRTCGKPCTQHSSTTATCECLLPSHRVRLHVMCGDTLTPTYTCNAKSHLFFIFDGCSVLASAWFSYTYFSQRNIPIS